MFVLSKEVNPIKLLSIYPALAEEKYSSVPAQLQKSEEEIRGCDWEGHPCHLIKAGLFLISLRALKFWKSQPTISEYKSLMQQSGHILQMKVDGFLY